MCFCFELFEAYGHGPSFLLFTEGRVSSHPYPKHSSKFELSIPRCPVPSFLSRLYSHCIPLALISTSSCKFATWCLSWLWVRGDGRWLPHPGLIVHSLSGGGPQRSSTRACEQLTADSEGRASHPRISLQLAAASLSHNPLLGLLQSFQQTLSEKKMSCKIKIDWFKRREGSPTC